MTHKDESIFPDDKENPQFNSVHYGLSKREFFAIISLQGLLGNSTVGNPTISTKPLPELLSSSAVKMADALISELNKPETST